MSTGVTFERLPPERRVVAPTAASAGSCCCCCCCCLHTVGSLVGALTGKPPKPETEVPVAAIAGAKLEPKYNIYKEYWVAVLLLSLVGLPILMAVSGEDLTEAWEWALVYALVLPGIQLAASIVVGIRNTFSNRPGKQERLTHLGSITVRAFLGTLIGILVMVVLF